MRTKTLTTLTLLSMLLANSSSLLRAHEREEYKVRVTRVLTGDRILVEFCGAPAVIGMDVEVKLASHNTADVNERGGRAAYEFTSAVLRDAHYEVTLRNVRRDRYYRLLADVYICECGSNLGDKLRAEGLTLDCAAPPPRPLPRPPYYPPPTPQPKPRSGWGFWIKGS